MNKKKLKKIGNVLFYSFVFGIVAYVIFTMSNLKLADPVTDNHSTQIQKEEITTDLRGNSTKKEPSKDYQKYVDGIEVKNIINYTTTYDNIELFASDDLFREEYPKATVFTFITKGGNALIGDICEFEIFNKDMTLNPTFMCYEVEDDNVLIIAVVDNDKLSLLDSKKNPLKVKISCMDEDGFTYHNEQELEVEIPVIDNESVFAGDLFKISDDGYGIRLNNAKDTDAMVRDDLVYNRMYYEFTNSMDIFTFGADNGFDLDKLSLDYDLPEGLEDFDDIEFVLTAQKMYSNSRVEYDGNDGLLCTKEIKIICTLDYNKLTDEEIKAYKEAINNATLVYNNIKMPLKEIITSENSETIQK